MKFTYLTVFFFFVTQAFSEEIHELAYSAPDQIVALTQELSKNGRIINPLSGQPCLRQTDLIAKGAQDVILKRVFVSQHRDWHANQLLLISKGLVPHEPHVESGWVIFPHIQLDHIAITNPIGWYFQKMHNSFRDLLQNLKTLNLSIQTIKETTAISYP